jgi:hypothetical protein
MFGPYAWTNLAEAERALGDDPVSAAICVRVAGVRRLARRQEVGHVAGARAAPPRVVTCSIS